MSSVSDIKLIRTDFFFILKHFIAINPFIFVIHRISLNSVQSLPVRLQCSIPVMLQYSSGVLTKSLPSYFRLQVMPMISGGYKMIKLMD